jgi:hypothetical protein
MALADSFGIALAIAAKRADRLDTASQGTGSSLRFPVYKAPRSRLRLRTTKRCTTKAARGGAGAFLTPRRLKVATIVLFVLALSVSSVRLSGSTLAHAHGSPVHSQHR